MPLGMFSYTVFLVLNLHSVPLREFGGLLVIVGVLGEFCVASRERQVESDLREENNSTIATLHDRAANAEREAAEANLARTKLEAKFRIPRFEDSEGLFWGTLLEYRGQRRVEHNGLR